MTVKKKISVGFLIFILICACIPLVLFIQPVHADPTSKMFVVCSDTHWGGSEGDGDSADDLPGFITCVKTKNPDYLFHLGDVTDTATNTQWNNARDDMQKIVDNVTADRCWYTHGGNHDGQFFSNFNSGVDMGIYRKMNHTSMYYTVKVGNNVFIFCGYISQPKEWGIPGEHGAGDPVEDKNQLMGQHRIDWLNSECAKWNGTGNNIFILTHTDHYKTIVCSTYGGHGARIKNSTLWEDQNRVKPLLENYTDIVAYLAGHLQTDSNATVTNCHYGASGTVMNCSNFGSWRDGLYFVLVTGIWKEHSPLDGVNRPNVEGCCCYQHPQNNYSSFRYFNLTNGNNYFDLQAWDTSNDTLSSISYDNQTKGNAVSNYRIMLPYTIQNIGDPLQYFPNWDVWRYSDEDGGYRWYRPSEGLNLSIDGYWIHSIWDFWNQKNFSNANFSVNSTDNSKLSYIIRYCNNFSVDNPNDCWSSSWWSQNNITDMPDAKYVRVNTTVNSPTVAVYVYDMNFSFAGAGGGSSDVEFVSINGQGNNSYVSVDNRTFVWDNVTNVDRFQLQVANSSTFASPFIDLNDINKTNYPSHYSASGDQVTFILPDAYNITYMGCHYYRVRALVDGG